MAKQPHHQEDTSSSRTAMIAMAIGALLVAGLVVWALTRTVEAPTTAPSVASEQFPTTTVPITQTATTTSPTITQAPPPSSAIASTAGDIVTSSQAPQAPPAVTGDKTAVHRIAAEDLREKFNANAVTIVDVRDQASYERGHIAGAIHIQLSSVEANLDLLPKGKDIVTYCT
jgi:hypothetical protein